MGKSYGDGARVWYYVFDATSGVVAFHLQNLGSIDPTDALVVAHEDSIFGQMTSNETTM
jgi:outer membrane protein assembly factor BamE (lipoprotein component of BamABCDE complex)